METLTGVSFPGEATNLMQPVFLEAPRELVTPFGQADSLATRELIARRLCALAGEFGLPGGRPLPATPGSKFSAEFGATDRGSETRNLIISHGWSQLPSKGNRSLRR